jgi:hypothetical protein
MMIMNIFSKFVSDGEQCRGKAEDTDHQSDYQLHLIHGYHRGTSLRSLIHDWYQNDDRVKRIIPGDNPGITVLVLKELY